MKLIGIFAIIYYIYGIIAYVRIYRRRKLRLNWPVLLAWPVVWIISMWRGGR